MIYFLVFLTALLAVYFLVPALILSGPDLSKYDRDDVEFFYDNGKDVSEGEPVLATYLKEHYSPPKGASIRETIDHLRKGYARQGRTREFQSKFTSATASFDGLDVKGEWTIPPGANPNKRILFVHGGAFLIGSPLSHRPITDNLARRTGCAVFAPDYRMGPDHGRKLGIADCRAAYHWILENGPEGPSSADKIAVAGDSAGGNLILMLLNYAKDRALRSPDAAIAMSPVTDVTAASPSVKTNAATDIILGPALTLIGRLPGALGLWFTAITGKINPSSIDASPIFADLKDLPPTLVQASNTEILYGDACRYAEKARQAGSPVTLQIWRGQAHVWQHYDEMIPEAHPALDEIAKFLKTHGVYEDGWPITLTS